MRNAATATFLMLFTVLMAHPAQAGEGCADTLGVSRTIEIDAKGGPWFGAPQGDPDFLAPGEVVLTFDDGPSPRSTRPILAALAAECTKATFFVLGEMAVANPDVIREIDAQGHTLGTHTWSHPNLKRLSEDKMKAQIELAFTAVETGAGHPIAPFFRYPYLSYTQASTAYLQGRNIAQFAIDIDSFDWRTHNPQSVIRQVETSLSRHGRGIILLHDIHPSTAAAVPGLLALLKAKGLRSCICSPKPPSKRSRTIRHRATHEPRYAGASRRRVVAHTTPTKPWLTSWKWPAW